MTWSVLPFEVGLRYSGGTSPRRADRAPGRCRWGACLAVRPRRPPARLRAQVAAEPAGERDQIDDADPVIAIHFEVQQVARVALLAPECAEEPPQVVQVHIAVAVAVPVEPEERVGAVAARGAVAVAVEGPAESVVDVVTANSQRVVAVRQRAGNDVRPREGEHGNRLTIDEGGGDVQLDR